MQHIFKVNSLPLKEVIESLATSFGVGYQVKCNEYSVKVPDTFGSGEIRGINFENGFGILVYHCCFKDDIRIDFTLNEVHPVKYIYSVEGPIVHSFANEKNQHKINQYQCAIVASESDNGHILKFEEGKDIHVVSLEIDREKFNKQKSCEINSLAPELKKLFQDTKASKTFYHEGFFGLDFQNLLNDISLYEQQDLIRNFNLESNALQIFIKQLIQFEDDLKEESSRTILRVNELSRIEDVSKKITKSLEVKHTIKSLSVSTGLNPNKLQTGFKYLFDMTVNEYINSVRLEAAKIHLSDQELSISTIANKIGFESNSYFSKIFKRHFEMTPKEYRALISRN
ncbi:MAG: helix-turn-helix transcriptional regulator [Patiriisocius sp.]|uniref:helix-turn-helix transcriptional regulator n=1 Tax=Patiriisocius sp. TaxID=2822396 RepID=UPI003EF33FA0